MTRGPRGASGRVSLFNVLNVDAARLARMGDVAGAVRVARAAASIERSANFMRLGRLLSGRPAAEVSALLEGDPVSSSRPEFHSLLAMLARVSGLARQRLATKARLSELVVGRVSFSSGVVILQSEKGTRTAVPLWLAQSAHRAHEGACLALVAEQFDDRSLVVSALPGIETRGRPNAPFTPYGREARVHHLTSEDAKRLSRKPEPLRIVVPVSIDP